MSDICNICCEKYNKSLNTKIRCEFVNCNYEACKSCIRTYLLSTTNDPHCMNCKNPWQPKFLVDNLNRSYVENDYKKHRKQLLVDREISRTPELMYLVERTKLVQESEEELKELNKEYIKARKLFNDLAQRVSEKRLEIHRIKTGEDTKEERKKFIMPCPGDNCKGYLSTQYKCEICKLFTCPDCFEIIGYSKEDHHICKEDNIKSAEMIKKETKGCPKCGVRIFKISGCDQMWCTECKVAFSWSTGKIIISGAIHNPHYYNYLQQNNNNGLAPRNPGDVVCGGLIAYYNLNYVTKFLSRFSHKKWFDYLKKDKTIEEVFIENNITVLNNLIMFITHLHRHINHITNVDLINCRNKVRDLENNDNETVQYILNNKTKDELARVIYKNSNLRKKHSELLNIYELLSVVGIERFNNIYNYYTENAKKIQENKNNEFMNFVLIIVNFINEYNNLIKYTNNQLITISYTYNLSVNLIKKHPNNYYEFRSGKFKQSDLNKINETHKKEKLEENTTTSTTTSSNSNSNSN